ncbi:hypothetical protein G7054_g11754 [Neopestalotiopsis clavispora]|nr:hypothetical protein E8E14_012659 [Neopestalotiopsis sp. 37M]KAF7523468.1 hypothetical protein G7054_g11754 [Neopestalotiopsis clavispora]
MSVPQGRKRARLACDTCRDLKRKCDGSEPCGTCVRFEYDCSYSEPAGRKSRRVTRLPTTSPSAAGPVSSNLTSPLLETGRPAVSNLHTRLRSLEANSGAAFLRRLALRIDANNAPRMHAFAWNAFLGTRSMAHTPVARPILEMLSEADMRELANSYFEKVDPIYGFFEREDVDNRITRRWATLTAAPAEDAVLCGIAALGYLFSHIMTGALELDLAESARAILERTMFDPPSSTSVTAWTLRVTYLRMTSTPHTTWMASCILMHMVEAAGLQYERAQESILLPHRENINPEIRKRLVAVAQHLNIWVSFDMGRSRVTVVNVTTESLTARPGDSTVELLELLPYSLMLDPERCSNVVELESALSIVLERTHHTPPSILAQCNLMLCLCRRLQSMNIAFTGTTLESILSLSAKGVWAASALLDIRSPWHHMVNVPFQVVCVLLAIDTLASTSQLRGALQCLNRVAAVYNTDATQEALRTASLLVSIHQKWKERFASNLSDALNAIPVTTGPLLNHNVIPPPEDTSWLDDLLGDLSTTQQFDLDRLLDPRPFWQLDGNTI